MRLPKQNKISPLPKLIFVIVFLLACWARAEEAAAPAGEGGEAPKVEDPFAKEWRDDEGRIQKLKSQIEKSKSELEELFASKEKVKGTAEAVSLTKEIIKLSATMKEDFTEYRKLQLHIRFKHPEQGNFSERKYEREEALTPEESHFDLSLQGRLDKVKSNFAAHYSVEHKKQVTLEQTEAERTPAAAEDSKRIVLAK
jgi:hypothetical protein